MPKMNVKKGDKVVVLSGKDKGKESVVLRAMPAEGKVVCEGVAVVKKATKPNAQNQQGGIIEKEAAIDASNVMLICPSCGKPTRVGHKSGELNGKKTAIRVCKKCGLIAKPRPFSAKRGRAFVCAGRVTRSSPFPFGPEKHIMFPCVSRRDSSVSTTYRKAPEVASHRRCEAQTPRTKSP